MAKIGDTVYVLREAENWQQYQVRLLIDNKQMIKHQGLSYRGTLTGDGYREFVWATSYIVGAPKRVVRKNPWPDIPIFDNEKDIHKFMGKNLLER